MTFFCLLLCHQNYDRFADVIPERRSSALRDFIKDQADVSSGEEGGLAHGHLIRPTGAVLKLIHSDDPQDTKGPMFEVSFEVKLFRALLYRIFQCTGSTGLSPTVLVGVCFKSHPLMCESSGCPPPPHPPKYVWHTYLVCLPGTNLPEYHHFFLVYNIRLTCYIKPNIYITPLVYTPIPNAKNSTARYTIPTHRIYPLPNITLPSIVYQTALQNCGLPKFPDSQVLKYSTPCNGLKRVSRVSWHVSHRGGLSAPISIVYPIRLPVIISNHILRRV